VGIHGTPDLGGLLTTRIDDVTDAANLSVPFHGGLRSIRVVLESRVEGHLSVEDWFLSGSGGTAAFGNELVLGNSMVDLSQLLLVRSKTF